MAAAEHRGFADQLNIETPEQVELEFAVAGIGSRFVALLIDHAIQAVFLLAFGLLATFLLGAMVNRSSLLGEWFAAVYIAVNFLMIWGYFTVFEAYWRGQTPGKRVMKLRVIKDSGRQITLFESMSRNLLRVVDYLPALYLTGVITMLATKRHQRLGDLAAGTIVVHERSDDQPLLIERGTSILAANSVPAYDPITSAAAMQSAGTLPADAVARLHADDLLLIESFFGRALDLNLSTRAEIAARIAAQMAAKMNVDVPAVNPERFLEAIAYAMRSSAHVRR
ncbi:MAG TPA: RDD family protein [Acidobacteriaceae bacterium]|jgi:uncharacterized RDD family membrane protein YckC